MNVMEQGSDIELTKECSSYEMTATWPWAYTHSQRKGQGEVAADKLSSVTATAAVTATAK